MRPNERQEEIVKLVLSQGEVSVDDLAARLGMSKETVRRDLVVLDSIGRVHKFHGGARIPLSAPDATVEGPFATRMGESLSAKRKIAQAAAALLRPGDSLFIDTGTTTLVLAEAILSCNGLTVITNSSRIAATVAANPENKVFLLGGAYSPDASETVGPLAVEQIGRFRAHHAFLTVGAVDKAGVFDFDEREAQIARAMIDRVESVTVLADSTKYYKRGIFELASWADVDRLVSDAAPPDEVAEAIRRGRAEVLIA